MKVINVKRKTKTKISYSTKIGKLTTKVTYVKKHFLGLPVKTLRKYNESYYSEARNYDDCVLFV
ncbi:hypothetical protein ACWGOQ_0000735 [Aquimarina sp. M1]